MALKRWVSGAQPASDIERGTISSASTGNTVVIKVGNKSITVTVGATTDANTVARAAVAAVNGDPLVADESRDFTGDDFAEFVDVEARIDPDDNERFEVIGTAGKEVDISITGTFTGSVATIQTSTGPSHWDEANNWSPSGVPGGTDDVVIDSGDHDILYELGQGGTVLASLKITNGFTGNIGLPFENREDEGNPYVEYRDRFLILGSIGSSATAIEIGAGEGAGSGRLNLHLDSPFNMLVHSTGQQLLQEDRPLHVITGDNAANTINVLRGMVGIATMEGEDAHFAAIDLAEGADVSLGPDVDLGDAVITNNGGILTVRSNTGQIINNLGETTLVGGTHADLDVFGGSIYPQNDGTITSLGVGGGARADFRRGAESWTVTNAFCYGGAEIRDPYKTVTWSNDVQVIAHLRDVTLDLGFNIDVGVS